MQIVTYTPDFRTYLTYLSLHLEMQTAVLWLAEP
jgi:hypothetical protein